MHDRVENELAQRNLVDEHLAVMAHAVRRRLLLRLRDGEVDEASFCRELEARDVATDPLVGLRHVHLPKLDAEGVIEWDREENRVRQGPAFEEIEPLLAALSNQSGKLRGEVP